VTKHLLLVLPGSSDDTRDLCHMIQFSKIWYLSFFNAHFLRVFTIFSFAIYLFVPEKDFNTIKFDLKHNIFILFNLHLDLFAGPKCKFIGFIPCTFLLLTSVNVLVWSDIYRTFLQKRPFEICVHRHINWPFPNTGCFTKY